MNSIKKYIFLVFVIFLWGYVLYKAGYLTHYDTNITVKIIKQKGVVKDLNTPVKQMYSKKIEIDTIKFPVKRVLWHHIYGNLGVANNFFMDIKTDIVLKKDAVISFAIGSDDGFRLSIDSNEVCSHIKNRAFAYTKCSKKVKKGKHKLHIFYYQGYGPMGLIAYYAVNHDRHLIGEDSKYLSFKKL